LSLKELYTRRTALQQLFHHKPPKGLGHRFRFGMHLQLSIDVLHVEVDGSETPSSAAALW
jgi:hypothetical protein